MSKKNSAVEPHIKKGVQYHIGLAKGDVAENILLCGDPARAERTAKLFDKVKIKRKNREFITYTGTYADIPVTVMSTGIGCDNTEIVVIELCRIILMSGANEYTRSRQRRFRSTKKPTFIRIGSSGALQKIITLGDLVISTGAVRLENTSLFFVPEGYPAIAHYEIVNALIQAAEDLQYPYHVGITATAPGFYGAQCRRIPGFPLRHPTLLDELGERNVLNFEMESSTLFTLANIRGIRAGTVCAVYANRVKNEFVTEKLKQDAELRCIKTGLKAVEILCDKEK